MALGLMFLSAGESSDMQPSIGPVCENISHTFGKQLTFKAIGYADPESNFDTLAWMTETFSNCSSNEFVHCSKHCGFGNALTSLVSSISASRNELSSFDADTPTRSLRKVVKETLTKSSGSTLGISSFDVYSIVSTWTWDLKSGSFVNNQWWDVKLMLAFRNKSFGEGAERIVFRAQLCTSSSLVGDPLVAKLSKYTAEAAEQEEDDKKCCRTQSEAASLASEFNRCVAALPGFKNASTPLIEFLSVTVYKILLNGKECSLLTEKMIDTEKYTKWNSNNGFVKGQVRKPINVDFEMKKQQAQAAAKGAEQQLDIIAEEGESDDDGGYEEETDGNEALESCQLNMGNLDPDDFLQAFSHFTHRRSRKKKLVCDLQGVYDTDSRPPIFRLTDPAIHYASAKGRRRVYGNTDGGNAGMDRFFNTHKCGPLCFALAPVAALSAKK
jgi:hypothetical protein